jgi:pteridine reductase
LLQIATLRHHDQILSMFDAIDAIGSLHALVNSAAVMLPRDLLTATEDDWQATMDLNLKAAYFVLQQAAIRMRSAGGGGIVNLADIAGLRPWPRFPIHSISKAGVLALTQVAALALAPEIRVNAVVPGPVLKPDRMPDERWRTPATRCPAPPGQYPATSPEPSVSPGERFHHRRSAAVDGETSSSHPTWFDFRSPWEFEVEPSSLKECMPLLS